MILFLNNLSLICLLGLTLCVGSCAKESEVPKPATSSTEPTTSIATSSDEMCNDLAGHAVGSHAQFSGFLSTLCSSKLTALRSSSYQYLGKGDPNIESSSSEQGAGKSYMQLWMSMLVPTDPKSYFNMMRLQAGFPEKFDDVFEYDQAVTYTKKSTTVDSVSYNYKNRKEDVPVDYDATSYYLEVVAGRTYVVTSELTLGNSVVVALRGLQVIHTAEGQNNVTEVFTMSDQTFENQNDHQGTISKAESSFKDEMSMSFRNGLKATQANQFFD